MLATSKSNTQTTGLKDLRFRPRARPKAGTPRDGGALVDAQAETSHARAEIGGARVKQALARTFVSQVLSGRKQSKDSAQLAITNTCVDDG